MKKFAKLLSKDDTGVLFCLIGIIVQGFHTFFIIYQGSSLSDGLKIWQSIMAALFFSFGLLYFLLKQAIARGDDNIPDREKFQKYVDRFTWFEIFINEWYWARAKIYIPYKKRDDLVLQWWETADWYDWSVLGVFAFAIPLVLQAYANSITLKTEEESTQKEREILDKYLPHINSIIDDSFMVAIEKQGTVTPKGSDKKEKRMILRLIKSEPEKS